MKYKSLCEKKIAIWEYRLLTSLQGSVQRYLDLAKRENGGCNWNKSWRYKRNTGYGFNHLRKNSRCLPKLRQLWIRNLRKKIRTLLHDGPGRRIKSHKKYLLLEERSFWKTFSPIFFIFVCLLNRLRVDVLGPVDRELPGYNCGRVCEEDSPAISPRRGCLICFWREHCWKVLNVYVNRSNKYYSVIFRFIFKPFSSAFKCYKYILALMSTLTMIVFSTEVTKSKKQKMNITNKEPSQSFD